MKFGKQLRETVESYSDAEWGAMCMNYKRLKKTLHHRPNPASPPSNASSNDSNHYHPPQPPSTTPTPTSPSTQASPVTISQAERTNPQFFSMLREQVDKVNDFFLDKQEDAIIQHAQLSSRAQTLAFRRVASAEEIARLRKRLTDFHGQLVLLEHFSIVNYTGFRKILKKYDKKTGMNIRHGYITWVLSTPFFQSSTVRKLIASTEAIILSLSFINPLPSPQHSPSASNASLVLEPDAEFVKEPASEQVSPHSASFYVASYETG